MMEVWAARGHNVFQMTGTPGQVTEENIAWMNSVINNEQPIIVQSELTEANLLDLSGSGGLFEEGFSSFGDELGMALGYGYEMGVVEEGGEMLLILLIP